MLEQLLKIVQESSQQQVVQNEQVPNELNSQVQEVISDTIQSGLSSVLSGGNIGSVLELFSSGAKQQKVEGNPITNMIMDQVGNVIAQKFNLSPEIGKMIASSVVPAVMTGFAQKVADPQDNSIDMNSVMGVLLGGGSKEEAPAQVADSGINFNDLLQDLTTGKKSTNDLADLAGTLLGSRASAGAKEQTGADGLLGALGKMLGG